VSRPTTADATIEIDAPPETIYDLVSDVARMGEWSPECRRCEWIDEPGEVGSTFKGHNRIGPVRWSTVSRVLVADRPREFSFATLSGDELGTRWTYRLQGDGPTTVTESFEAIRTPRLIDLVERVFLPKRHEQLEAGMARTLAALKAAAESAST
jgi:uncharacterized protein YndB with AHSA1/START domain